MSRGESTAAAVEALLAVVAADREARRREIIGPAQAAAQARIAEARRQLANDLRRALDSDRAQLRTKRERARAQLDAARRERQQRLAQAAAEQGWASLGAALAERWRDPPRRQRWIAAALAVARARLPAGAWLIRHAPGLASAEADALLEQLAAQGIGGARCEADAALEAGIVIRAGGAQMDASAAGLLADRGAVLGRLLHFWELP